MPKYLSPPACVLGGASAVSSDWTVGVIRVEQLPFIGANLLPLVLSSREILEPRREDADGCFCPTVQTSAQREMLKKNLRVLLTTKLLDPGKILQLQFSSLSALYTD